MLLIGAPAAGKSTLARAILAASELRGHTVVHLDDKTELVALCLSKGSLGHDYGLSPAGVVTWVRGPILARRMAALRERLENHCRQGVEAAIVELSSLDYVAAVPEIIGRHAPIRPVLLRASDEVLVARNRQRGDGVGHERPVPEAYLIRYLRERRANEAPWSAHEVWMHTPRVLEKTAADLATWVAHHLPNRRPLDCIPQEDPDEEG